MFLIVDVTHIKSFVNADILGLVVVRGFEPLQEEPKSSMLTITSHNNNQLRLYLTTYLSSDTITLKLNTQ